ncbi:hypothetical protein QJ857_gp1142 [Tupanvirus soda lake]|uniref:Uncharacterized protein n=2 Tax=Tupanvirus TaxID=2094720 RepID=A0A6N1NXK3_9VIRU|nr:hypothetical protein QJ857_gp1142 [Tupanvirus soda lake]QKU34912.1 hypothetical protein [Tupanvirus soda lake]
MGRCGGFYGGCGPCGGGYYDNSFANNGWNNGYNADHAQDSYAARNSNVVANKREVYYEKEACYNSNDSACCANRERDQCGSWNGGCNSCGNYGTGYGGCGYGGPGPYYGGCGPRKFYGKSYGGYYKPYGYGKNYGPRGFGAPNAKLHKGLGYNVAKRSGYDD